jgi:hypothetical protein
MRTRERGGEALMDAARRATNTTGATNTRDETKHKRTREGGGEALVDVERAVDDRHVLVDEAEDGDLPRAQGGSAHG